jgi:hypothetical protein
MARFGIMALLVISSIGAWASEGVFLLGNDALQLGRASSGVASPRSAYWSYMNPVSMLISMASSPTSIFIPRA